MVNLHRLEVFAAVVERGSFTRAAEQLGLTKAMVSMHMKQLEAEVGAALLTRTTRRVAPTDAGRRFHERALHILRSVEAAVGEAREERDVLSGTLRVTTTLEYGTHLLVPALAEFARINPKLKIALSVSSRVADLVGERFDVAVRMGQLRDSSHLRTQLGRFRVIVVASPAYLEGKPRPRTPSDLRDLDWVLHTGLTQPRTWISRGPRPLRYTLKPSGSIEADSAAAMLGFVLAGRGLAILPEWLIAESRAAGRLVELAPDFQLPEQGIYAVYPRAATVPAKVRRFVDFVRGYVAR
jgi:DNA-binding transcriptional LysR family regulator